MLNLFNYAIIYLATAEYSEAENVTEEIDSNVVKTENFVLWTNAVIPFYIEPEHFDHEQSLSIMKALSLVAFKTCLKFNPVLVQPSGSHHVLVFENPNGVRKCVFNTEGHFTDSPHRITLGYDCMKSPQIDMMLMRALGFPFEHNRASRDLFIDVQFENIDPDAVILFTKDSKLPPELRPLRYDVNSVMHFGERDYSKNGHRTILFKDYNTKQNRNGLSDLDLRKIEIVYGPECLKRERQEKVELCQNYPGVARRKRQIDLSAIGPSLRVNREITVPPETTNPIQHLGIVKEVDDIKKKLEDMSAKAVLNARVEFCNETTPVSRSTNDVEDPLGTGELIENYVRSILDHAKTDSKSFCDANSVSQYLRSRCDNRLQQQCRQTYKSTKSGDVIHSTNHKPTYQYPTKLAPTHRIFVRKSITANDDRAEVGGARRKREATTESVKEKGDITSKDKTTLKSKEELSKSVKDLKTALTKSLVPEIATDRVEGGRRRFENSKISGRKRKAHKAKDASNILIDAKRKKTTKKVKPSQKNIAREVTEKRRKKQRNVQKVTSRIRSKREANNTMDDKNEETKAISTNTSLIHTDKIDDEQTDLPKMRNEGKRRFSDTHFTVHKHKKNVKKLTYGSDLSLERKREKRFKTIGTRSSPKKGKQRKTRGAETTNRTKRSAQRTVQENGERYDDAKSNETHINGKRRFKDAPFSVYKAKRDKNKSYFSDLSLENKQEDIFKKSRPATVMDVDLVKKKRGKERSKSISKDERVTPRKHTPRTVSLSKANEEFYAERIWPGGVVRYMIKDIPKYDIEDLRLRLDEVNRILKAKTCVRLEEIGEDDAERYTDYLILDNSPDFVTGRVGGKQNFGVVELFEGGQHRQHAAMVVMAMMGFYLEPSRHDRDRYIRVHPRHIRPDKLHHFEKLRPEATLPLPYDFESASQPAWQFWRRLGKSGISSVATYKDQDPDGSIMKSMGHNTKLLSDLDIVKINSVYGVKCFK